MICPSSQSEAYAKAEGLAPFGLWVRLTNSDTYITGQFDFADGYGKKTRDRVPQDRWEILSKYGHMFSNEVPSLSLPEYSVHFGQFHTTYDVPQDNWRMAAWLAHPLSPDMV